MNFLDDATVYLIHLTFILIVIIFVMTITLNIIAKFFRKFFDIGKKNERFDKN
jgi:uncharacterized protein HemY